ncbi:MAG: diguanylate cyclase, partial [Mariprofundales bacterium]|nr:diguanylate cyclase [Mariprofundales bacterium]
PVVQSIEYPVTALIVGMDRASYRSLEDQLSSDGQLELIYAENNDNPQKIAAHRGVTVVVQQLPETDLIPNISNHQLIRDYHDSEVCHDIPILALVPTMGAAIVTGLLQAGAEVVLQSPIDPELLKTQMRSLARIYFDRIELDSLRQALHKSRKRLKEAREQVKQLVEQDELTGLFTPQRFALLYDIEWQRAMRETNPIALLVIEIDHFKQYQAHYGKQVADDCIKQVAHAILSCLNRTTDIAARSEGGEFTVLLPNTPVAGGVKVGAAMHQAVQELRLLRDEADNSSCVTISLGLVTTSPMVRHTAQMLRLAAAKALSNAKSKGGDQLACEAI